MTRTQHWLLAISLFITLVLIGITATLLLKPQAIAMPINQQSTLQSTSAVMSQTAVEKTLDEQTILQKVSQLLPTQTAEKIQKVNYQGTLAYEVITRDNQLYLNGTTGDVLAITNRANASGYQTAQYTYQNQASDEDEGYDEEEYEGDDDD